MLKKLLPVMVAVGLAGGLAGCYEQEREFRGGGGGEVEQERSYNPIEGEAEMEEEREVVE